MSRGGKDDIITGEKDDRKASVVIIFSEVRATAHAKQTAMQSLDDLILAIFTAIYVLYIGFVRKFGGASTGV